MSAALTDQLFAFAEGGTRIGGHAGESFGPLALGRGCVLAIRVLLNLYRGRLQLGDGAVEADDGPRARGRGFAKLFQDVAAHTALRIGQTLREPGVLLRLGLRLKPGLILAS